MPNKEVRDMYLTMVNLKIGDDKIYMSNLLQDKGWKTKMVERQTMLCKVL